MALHLDLTELFSDNDNDLRLSHNEAMALFASAEEARNQHLLNKPKWRELGHLRDHLLACQERAAFVKANQEIDNFVVFGIGGSALGSSAIMGALGPIYQNLQLEHNSPQVFVIDSVDPDWLSEFFEKINLERTHINVISKSGGTIETSAQFLLAFDRVLSACDGDRERCISHFTITTDQKSGHFRSFCDEENFSTLAVPEGVGGRFSVLSSVGLFTSEMAGFDTESMLQGAARVADSLANCEALKDPALWYALMHTAYMDKSLDKHVHFAYGHRLRLLCDWYSQLWAESLGKRTNIFGEQVCIGPTPISAVGPTDQHSQSQLYVDGPKDKVFTMLKVKEFNSRVDLPKTFVDSPAFTHLENGSLNDLREREREGTMVALIEEQSPVCVIELCKLDAFHLGQYFMFMQITTAYAGGILKINPFDQPGVEAGKVAALALMGCAGYESRAEEIRRIFDKSKSFKLSC